MCSIEGTHNEKIDEIILYNCQAETDDNEYDKIVVNPNLSIDGENFSTDSDSINFSELAAIAAQDLKETPTVDKIYKLDNGEIV